MSIQFLHICDYRLPYTSLERFLDYPGQVVNTSLGLASSLTARMKSCGR